MVSVRKQSAQHRRVTIKTPGRVHTQMIGTFLDPEKPPCPHQSVQVSGPRAPSHVIGLLEIENTHKRLEGCLYDLSFLLGSIFQAEQQLPFSDSYIPKFLTVPAFPYYYTLWLQESLLPSQTLQICTHHLLSYSLVLLKMLFGVF